jgi:hypothetical protein
MQEVPLNCKFKHLIDKIIGMLLAILAEKKINDNNKSHSTMILS